MAEHRRDNAFDQAVGKHIFQLEFNFAGIFTQRCELPVAGQLFEWAIHQRDIHFVRKLLVVACGEMLDDAMVTDMDCGLRHLICALDNLAAATPWQEAGVILYGIHQLKHGFTGVHHQYGFFYLSHLELS